MTSEYKKLARILRRAGRTIRRADLSADAVAKKGEDTANLVTVYDKAVQDYLERALLRLFPEAVFMSCRRIRPINIIRNKE